ncbi:permease for cytosine/purines, uracil, thiamine, allantoin-domain-containing protein [Scenedesmus sp. NREL 46B-D3]|nr:permease for cytosine/purines, uracil, thiamine, allantoin-domain-containing protein [Scenedesmus sp. NREL 46B-D3]
MCATDLLPTPASKRTFAAADFAALWVTLVISITTYYLAASLVDMGMSWWQGVLTVFVGNLLTLVPMVLNAHAGTKYGIPFPVLARASFGIKGSNLPSLSRALVACGWFGIQTWIGGSSIHQMLQAVAGSSLSSRGSVISWLGITGAQLGCFLAFWVLQVAIIVRGIDCIKQVEKFSAPILVGLAAALLIWAVTTAGGLGPMLSAPSQFGPGMPLQGRFWQVAVPAVTANVGYWATLSLNIPDFSRYAVSQRAQLLGQAAGLPPFMALFSFIGLAVTSATVVIYGAPVVDPVQLLSHMKQPVAVCVSLFGLILATLTTNIAANVVAPANAIVNVAPRAITFTTGGIITALLGLCVMPWRLMGSSGGFVNWLVAYSALLGPVVGVVLADYYLVRGRRLDMDDLYSMSPSGRYWYTGGYNVAALVAVVAGVLPCLPGLMASVGLTGSIGPVFSGIYDCAWFVGVAVSTMVYCCCMGLSSRHAAGTAAA